MSMVKKIDRAIMGTGDTIVETGKLAGKLLVSAGVGIVVGTWTAADVTVDLGAQAIKEFRERI